VPQQIPRWELRCRPRCHSRSAVGASSWPAPASKVLTDREHATELLKGKVGPHGVHVSTPGVLTKAGTDRRAAQLATRRSDLAEAVPGG
jgi:hypothetical protein